MTRTARTGNNQPPRGTDPQYPRGTDLQYPRGTGALAYVFAALIINLPTVFGQGKRLALSFFLSNSPANHPRKALQGVGRVRKKNPHARGMRA